jgi:hypothetical protein
MTSKAQGVDVTAPENNVVADDNLDYDVFESQLFGAKEEVPQEEGAEPEEDEVVATEEVEDSPAEDEGTAEEHSAESQNDVLSQLNLEDMSAEEIATLAEQLKGHLTGSKSAERIGELTRKNKEKDERLSQVEQKLQELESKKNPLERDRPIKDNPFNDIESVEKLQDKYEEFGRIYEWADQLLEDNDDARYDDVIVEEGGKEFTKKQIKDMQRNAYQSREKFLPARAKELQQMEQTRRAGEVLQQRAKTELEWMATEDSKTYKEYQAIIHQPIIQDVLTASPQAEALLKYALAHAVDNITKQEASAKPAATKPKDIKMPKKSPPATLPNATAKAPMRDSDISNKHLADLQKRFETEQSNEAFTALLTAQMS